MNEEICEHGRCTGCEACVQACPVQCISMTEENDGFFYPRIDINKCIHCNKCRKICPVNTVVKKNNESSFFMGWHKDEEILRQSSSGGAFTAIAKIVLDKGGVVFGAYFDENDFTVKHIDIESEDDLYKLRLSKYYQSRINSCYVRAKEYLESGRLVLFSGTACQIAGLYNFIGKKYNNLITVDVLCHGATSKKVVEEYIRSKEKKYKKKVRTFRFRLKPNDSDWQRGGGTRMRIDFLDGTHKVENKDTDTFFVGFNDYLFLRNSCYNCQYTGTKRIADITLADFWGVDLNDISEHQRRYGVSLILVNSEKGKKIVSLLHEDMEIHSADKERAVSGNLALRRPGRRNKKRELFFKNLGIKDFDELVKKYESYKYFQYIRKKIIVSVIGDSNYEKLKKKLGRG